MKMMHLSALHVVRAPCLLKVRMGTKRLTPESTEMDGAEFDVQKAWTERERLAALDAYAIVGSLPETAFDDIAQIAFIEAYAKIDQYEPGTEFYVWLWVFARNTLLMHIRKAKRLARREETYVDMMLLENSEQELPTGGVADDDHVKALRGCLSKLPEEAISMLRMRYNEKASVGAVAKGVGKSVTAVKSKLFALRCALRKCVESKLRTVRL